MQRSRRDSAARADHHRPVKGHLRQVGPRKFRLYWDIPRDPITNKRRQRTRIFHGPRAKAETELASRVAEANIGRTTGADNATVGDLIAKWTKQTRSSWTVNTLHGYESKIRTHILPRLGSERLRDLTTETLDNFYADLESGATNTGRGKQSPNSIGGVHRILHAALEQAVRWKWITDNPAENARHAAVEEAEDLDLDPELVMKILYAAPADTLGDIAFLAAITGAREGELCALRWGDFDQTQRTLAFRRRIMKDGTVRAKTKNRKSRPLGLDRRTVARLRLRHHHARQRAAVCAIELTDRAYIFSETADGLSPVLPGTIAQRWYKHRTIMGSTLTFHGLRHWSLSALLDSDHQLARVSKRGGHSRQSTTANVYSHVMRATDHDLADSLAAKLRKKR